MKREVLPEILDSLPKDHPDALHNRRDIALLNRLMGNHRWLADALVRHCPDDRPAIEIGAGDGVFAQRVLQRHPGFIQQKLDGLDQWHRPADWPTHWDWHEGDLLTFEHYGRYPVIAGNLILHQFDDALLREIGPRLRQADVLIFCETARRWFHFLQLRLAVLLGMNHVSRHDGAVSIRAGFLRGELPALLGLDPADWQISESLTFLGAYRMIACRRQPLHR